MYHLSLSYDVPFFSFFIIWSPFDIFLVSIWLTFFVCNFQITIAYNKKQVENIYWSLTTSGGSFLKRLMFVLLAVCNSNDTKITLIWAVTHAVPKNTFQVSISTQWVVFVITFRSHKGVEIDFPHLSNTFYRQHCVWHVCSQNSIVADVGSDKGHRRLLRCLIFYLHTLSKKYL